MESYESTTRRMPAEQPGLCALVQDTLPFYMDGDISPESRAFITTHLDGCLACSQFLAGARSAQSHLRRETVARRSPFHAVQRRTKTDRSAHPALFPELARATCTLRYREQHRTRSSRWWGRLSVARTVRRGGGLDGHGGARVRLSGRRRGGRRGLAGRWSTGGGLGARGRGAVRRCSGLRR